MDSLQNYATSISNQLSDVETLDSSRILPKLQQLTNTGLQPYIIQTIRNCITNYQKDRGLMKYAHVLDKLLKFPGWNQLVQKVIVQFFCDIFIFLLIQKCFNQIDELKIIRKFWLNTIHPKLHQTMKDFILAQTAIDIDQYFISQAIGLLKSHYQQKLRLTSQQINFHLPKTVKTSNAIYESHINRTQKESVNHNANYIISQPTHVNPYVLNSSINANIVRHSPEPMMRNPNQPYYNPYPSVQPGHYYPNPLQMIENDPFRMKTNFPQRVSPPIDPRDPRVNIQKPYAPNQGFIQQRENLPFYPERNQLLNESYKRERLYSEETRTPNGSEHLLNPVPPYPYQKYSIKQYEAKETFQMVPPPLQKKVHYNEDYLPNDQKSQKIERVEQKPKHTKILEMLRNDKIFKCKQCGKGYKSMKQYENHTSQHFQERLSLREKRKAMMKLLNLDEWTQKGSGSSLQQFEQFYISLSNLCSEQKKNFQPLQLKCSLCNQAFDLKFRLDQWTLSHATYCEIDGVLAPMHKKCQQALEDSSSGEYF